MSKELFSIHSFLIQRPKPFFIVPGKLSEKCKISVSRKTHDVDGFFCNYLNIPFLQSISDKFANIFELILN